MEEIQSKRKRICSLQPRTTFLATFSLNYLNYLLPALQKLGRNGSCEADHKEEETAKSVRFHVKMALALSAAGFTWSHALKRTLERDMAAKSLHLDPSLSFHPLPRPLLLRGSPQIHNLNHLTSPTSSKASENIHGEKNRIRRTRRKRSRNRGGVEDLGERWTALRRVLPGGDEMEEYEILTQVASYVVCLQLQDLQDLNPLGDQRGYPGDD